MDLKDLIRKKKPNITDSSVNTYNQILTSIAKKLNFHGKELTPKFFNDHQKQIIEILKDKNISTRKTCLSALILICDDNHSDCIKKYRDLLKLDVDKYNNEKKEQKKSEKQKVNWLSQEQIKKHFDDLKKEVNYIWTKSNPTNKELQRLQDFVILSIYTLVPPRRLKDYIDFKINKIDTKNDNYLKGNTFIFNSYKTSKKYGKQQVKIPPLLRTIINKWTNVIKDKSDYLLFSSNFKPLLPAQLTLRLNKIFGKHSSVNILRESYLTDKYSNVPALKEIAKTEQNLGNSFMTALESYVKKD